MTVLVDEALGVLLNPAEYPVLVVNVVSEVDLLAVQHEVPPGVKLTSALLVPTVTVGLTLNNIGTSMSNCVAL